MGMMQGRKGAAGEREAAEKLNHEPAVLHRPTRKPWVVIVYADELIRLLDVVGACRARVTGGSAVFTTGGVKVAPGATHTGFSVDCGRPLPS